MRQGRPVPLALIERDQMHQLTTAPTANRTAAALTMKSAKAFQQSAERDRTDGLALPAASSFHEAARLAITAIATANGRRFSNAAGAHEAVVDYALGIGLADAGAHARLDTLRELRHNVNYPADLVEPSAPLLEQIAALVNDVITAASARLAPPPTRRPPPPPRPSR